MRLEKFISDNDFQIIEGIASDYIENVLNSVIWLYSIDRQKTPRTGSFEETKGFELQFKDPIQIPAIIQWEESENKAYDVNQTTRFSEYGNFLFHVLNKHIREKNVQIIYGDFIAYEVEPEDFVYFKIVDDNIKNHNNSKTWGGFRSIYRTIKCTPVDKNELEFIK